MIVATSIIWTVVLFLYVLGVRERLRKSQTYARDLTSKLVIAQTEAAELPALRMAFRRMSAAAKAGGRVIAPASIDLTLDSSPAELRHMWKTPGPDGTKN